MTRIKRSTRSARDRNIYRDYFGLNEDQVKVPVAVLHRRYSLTRGRVYQIIGEQTRKHNNTNGRIGARFEDSDADAEKVAEMLRDLLEA